MKAIETVYNGYKFRSRLEARWAVFFDTLRIEYQYEPEGFDLGELGWYLPDFWIKDWECWVEIKPIKPNLRWERNEYRLCEKLAKDSKRPVLLIGGTPGQKEYIDPKTNTIDIESDYIVAMFSPDMIVGFADRSDNGIEFSLPLPVAGICRLTEEFFTSSVHLYGFIYSIYQEYNDWFSKPLPIRGDAFGLIEADNIYFQKKYNKGHWAWKYNIAQSGLVFSANGHCDGWKSLGLEDHLFSRINHSLQNAYDAARQARFEHGENGKL